MFVGDGKESFVHVCQLTLYHVCPDEFLRRRATQAVLPCQVAHDGLALRYLHVSVDIVGKLPEDGTLARSTRSLSLRQIDYN